jgi:hypothetical protein
MGREERAGGVKVGGNETKEHGTRVADTAGDGAMVHQLSPTRKYRRDQTPARRWMALSWTIVAGRGRISRLGAVKRA